MIIISGKNSLKYQCLVLWRRIFISSTPPMPPKQAQAIKSVASLTRHLPFRAQCLSYHIRQKEKRLVRSRTTSTIRKKGFIEAVLLRIGRSYLEEVKLFSVISNPFPMGDSASSPVLNCAALSKLSKIGRICVKTSKQASV